MNENDRRLWLRLRWAAVALGLVHLAIMTVFALGPELAPLVVCLCDYPGYVVLSLLWPENEAVVIAGSLIACSVIYPLLLYWAVTLVVFCGPIGRYRRR